MAGPREGPLILLFLVLTLAASAFVLHQEEADAVKDPKQKAARGEVSGLSELSLVRPENLRRALANVEAGKYPLISTIRVAADRVNLSVRDDDGYRKYLTIDPSFGVETSDAGVGEDYAVTAAEIDVEGPQRMLKAVVAKTGLSPAVFDYVATSFSEGSKATWFLAMKDGPARMRQWLAEMDGTDIRRPGEPSAAQKREQRETARKNAAVQRRIQRRIRHTQAVIKRRTRCINRAKDAEQVSRCLERFQP